jgi:Eco47II restriction endonuclease
MSNKDEKQRRKECKKMSVPDECKEHDTECMINKSGKCQKKPIHVTDEHSDTPTLVNSIKSKKMSPIKKERLTDKKTRKKSTLKSNSTESTEPTEPTESSVVVDKPSWYKIREINPRDFVHCVKGIYSVLDKTHKSKTNEDPFIKAVIIGHNDMSNEDWEQSELSRLSQKVLEMKMGNFHEELMGKIPGYETYKVGHSTGCDVGSIDGMEIYEVKNKDNTTKGSDGKHIIHQLTKLLEKGIHPIYVQINCPNGKVQRFNAPEGVDVWNGRKTYHHMTGREAFFDDLQDTVKHVFLHYKTIQELKSALGIF